ncbi:multidrug efflux SMR transporter [Saccharibacter sp. 17.LH.SD]|uniref:DMT family transporter n=1 Tax=Saccharibacter sp. 17.LH.SD TaxID=2689393 RepID=UPI001F1EA5B6|nr:multidrug efflux SMR transporter [Saccharibacter sp. 17.LH.SD]
MMASSIAWVFLFAAIFLEVGATSLLNLSDGFRRLLPTASSLALYAGAFFCLSRALKHIPLGIAYAVWCGFGIVCIVAIGVVVFRQSLPLPAYGGIALIVLGTILASIFGGVHEWIMVREHIHSHTSKSPTKNHWGFVYILLIAFLGQIALNSFSHFGEPPRATIERLTGIDIAPSTMDMPGSLMHHHQKKKHHDDGCCSLCPLLGHILFTLTILLIWYGVSTRPDRHWFCSFHARSPPCTSRERPPGRAPPHHHLKNPSFAFVLPQLARITLFFRMMSHVVTLPSDANTPVRIPTIHQHHAMVPTSRCFTG